MAKAEITAKPVAYGILEVEGGNPTMTIDQLAEMRRRWVEANEKTVLKRGFKELTLRLVSGQCPFHL